MPDESLLFESEHETALLEAAAGKAKFTGTVTVKRANGTSYDLHYVDGVRQKKAAVEKPVKPPAPPSKTAIAKQTTQARQTTKHAAQQAHGSALAKLQGGQALSAQETQDLAQHLPHLTLPQLKALHAATGAKAKTAAKADTVKATEQRLLTLLQPKKPEGVTAKPVKTTAAGEALGSILAKLGAKQDLTAEDKATLTTHLPKLTIPQLKQLHAALGVKAKGNKPELVKAAGDKLGGKEEPADSKAVGDSILKHVAAVEGDNPNHQQYPIDLRQLHAKVLADHPGMSLADYHKAITDLQDSGKLDLGEVTHHGTDNGLLNAPHVLHRHPDKHGGFHSHFGYARMPKK
jgi:hypothetical protein